MENGMVMMIDSARDLRQEMYQLLHNELVRYQRHVRCGAGRKIFHVRRHVTAPLALCQSRLSSTSSVILQPTVLCRVSLAMSLAIVLNPHKLLPTKSIA